MIRRPCRHHPKNQSRVRQEEGASSQEGQSRVVLNFQGFQAGSASAGSVLFLPLTRLYDGLPLRATLGLAHRTGLKDGSRIRVGCEDS